jgi:uncharacterized membrane protein
MLWISPVLIIALSIPMVLGKIPPNRFYGFRTRKTLSNLDVWYRANRLAGINLIIASFASLFISTLLMLLLPETIALLAGNLLLAMALMLATGIGFWQLRKL